MVIIFSYEHIGLYVCKVHTLYLVLERTWLISKSLVKDLDFEATGSGSYTH